MVDKAEDLFQPAVICESACMDSICHADHDATTVAMSTIHNVCQLRRASYEICSVIRALLPGGDLLAEARCHVAESMKSTEPTGPADHSTVISASRGTNIESCRNCPVLGAQQ